MQFHDLCRVGTARPHLRNVDEAVFVQAYVHERTEIGDVGHYARKLHSGLEIVYGMDVVRECEFGCLLARVWTMS